VRNNRSFKIDHDKDYPCPCRRRGRLFPIYLTEAFGCDLCQQIFSLEENGYTIEQLNSIYPYKKSWRWTGYHWIAAHKGMKDSLLPLILISFCIVIIIFFRLVLGPASLNILFPWLITAGFIIMITLLVWAISRM
jgi:hypothetical protein